MARNQRGATFVLLTLVSYLIVGILVAVRWAARDGMALLITTAFLTTAFAVLAGWVAVRTWRKQRDATDPMAALIPAGARRTGLWHLLTRRQWNILMLGLTADTALTGSAGAAEVMVSPGPAGVHAASPPPATATIPEYSPTPSLSPVDTASPADMPSTDTTSTGGPTAGGSADGTPAPGATAFLDEADPVDGSRSSGAVSFSGRRYPRSVTIRCQSAQDYNIVWNVAGYRTFTATLGVPDDAANATGDIAEMIFYDQDNRQIGGRYEVRLGRPEVVQLSLSGVVQLRATCSGRDAKTGEQQGFTGALGDAAIVN